MSRHGMPPLANASHPASGAARVAMLVAAPATSTSNGHIANRPGERCLHPWLLVAMALATLGSCAADSRLPADTDAAGTDAARAAASTTITAADVSAARDPAAMTYYIRIDGGDANQCTGRADAPYPGAGTHHACAWKHPFDALPPDGALRIAGGDTLVIGAGSYLIGPDPTGAGACVEGACVLPPIPSGPSATTRTRIIGAPCSAAPTLWGTGGIGTVLSLEGSSNVEIGCLQITDRSDCVLSHSNPAAKCPGNGAWARTGVTARASSNVRLHDLTIRGMAHTGINAGGLTDWTLERVRIRANGRAGWDGNIGETGSGNAGRIVLRHVEIGWNGCGERWQTGEPWACWAQKSGGYGDGLGTKATGGQWLVEDSYIHHNTSDGLDLRYMDGADTSNVTVRRTRAVGNAGNQIKVRGNSTIENSVIVGNCGHFSDKYFMADGDHCRAGGNAIQLVLSPNDVATIRHNTIAGEGGVLIGATEGDGSARVAIQNNVLIGYPTFANSTRLSAAYFANDAPAAVYWAGNLVWNVRNAACPADSICNQHPRLANLALATFDAQPLAGSPVIGRVRAPAGLAVDLRGTARPADGTAAIGAIEAAPR